MTVSKWALGALAAVSLLGFASRAEAQPGGPRRAPAIIVYPQANNAMLFPVTPLVRPGFNPALNNPYLNQTNVIPYNPFAPNPFFNPFVPTVTATPALAIRQPGQLFYKGPDLQVNPVSGLVYKPLSGVAQTADGSTYYRVIGSGQPTAIGTYATGTGLYFDPVNNNFLNPATGVISRPGTTNVFIPWRP